MQESVGTLSPQLWHLSKYIPLLPLMHGAFPPGVLAYFAQFGWNLQALDLTSAMSGISRNNIILLNTKMKWHGLYTIIDGQATIVLNDELSGPYRTFVLFHEMVHAWLHSSDVSFCEPKRRVSPKEIQAHVFAAVAMVPQCFLERFTASEMAQMFAYPPDLIQFRQQIEIQFGF
jgi:hypothetical protein